MLEHWIEERLTKAREGHPSVPEGVVAHLKNLLEDHGSERQLTATELDGAADDLVRAMAEPTKGAAEERHET